MTATREDVRVVVVDDEPGASASLAALLELDGYNVRTACSGAEAILVVGEHSPQCVVMDLGLPDLDGRELARRLREAHGADLVLVALTGWTREADRAEAEKAGIDFILSKPLDPAALRLMLPPIH